MLLTFFGLFSRWFENLSQRSSFFFKARCSYYGKRERIASEKGKFCWHICEKEKTKFLSYAYKQIRGNKICFFLQIDTAVRFLQNPKVVETPLSRRKQFLLKKGNSYLSKLKGWLIYYYYYCYYCLLSIFTVNHAHYLWTVSYNLPFNCFILLYLLHSTKKNTAYFCKRGYQARGTVGPFYARIFVVIHYWSHVCTVLIAILNLWRRHHDVVDAHYQSHRDKVDEESVLFASILVGKKGASGWKHTNSIVFFNWLFLQYEIM